MNATAATQMSSAVRPHLHTENCPTCDQPIANEKAAEIRARAEAKSRELTEGITARLNEEFKQRQTQVEDDAAARIAQAEQDKLAALEKAQSDFADKEAAARAEGERMAGEKAKEALAEAEANSQAALNELQQKLTDSEQSKKESQAKMAEMETAHAEDMARRLKDSDTAAEARLQAALAAQSQTADDTIANLQESLESEKRSKEETANQLATLKSEHETALATKEAEVKAEAERVLAEKMAEKDRAAEDATDLLKSKLAEAERLTQEAQAQNETLKSSQEAEVASRVQEVRSAMEESKSQALNDEKAKHASEILKLTGKLEDVTRQLENKTAAELGEGAEVKLYEELRDAFKGDNFKRVQKGSAGADIIHEVMNNGQVCGTIIYDSKNRNRWCKDYATKLREDQIAARADFAVLAALKFPADQSQVHVLDEVIIANPARVVAIVELLRKSVIGMHTLRVSNSDRAKKSAAVFDLIRSERFRQLFGKFEKHSDGLLKLQEKERKDHEKHWLEEGKLLRNIQKAHSELNTEINTAMGLSGETE